MANRQETMETVTDLIFLGSKITADSDCSHKIKRHLLLGRKSMTNLGSVLKSRDITLPTKVHIVKAMVFPVVMYRYESWTINKAEHWRIDAFELWCWRRLLRVPWTARSNQSIWKKSVLNIYWKDWSWGWNSNTLATWCEELTHWKRLRCWEKLKAEGEGDNRGRDGWMVSPTKWRGVWENCGRWWRTAKPGMLKAMVSQRVRHYLAVDHVEKQGKSISCIEVFLICGGGQTLGIIKFTEITKITIHIMRKYFHIF